MSSTDCLRLFVLCFWLLVGDVNCENTQRGYVLRVQAGQAPKGVHNDNGDHERLSEPSIFRKPTSGYRMPSLDRGQSHYPYPVIPETQNGNVNHFESGFNSASATRGRNPVVYNRSGHKAVAFPGSKKIHQSSSDSVFSPHMYGARTKSTGRFSPVQVDNAAVGFNSHSSTASPDIQAVKSSLKSGSHKIDATPNRQQSLQPQESLLATRPEVKGYHSAHLFHNSFKPINKHIDSTIKGHSPGSNSAGKGGTQMSSPTKSPRVYSSDVMSEGRGYAHVLHLRPGFDKTGPHASSTAGKKFSEAGVLCANQGKYGHDSRKPGFGPGVSSSSERQQNLNHNSRGSQSSSQHPPLSDRSQNLVQGKFKPFERLSLSDELPARTNLSDNETAPTQEAAGTTLPPSLNSTGITAIVTGEIGNKSASPMQTEAPDVAFTSSMTPLWPIWVLASLDDGQSGNSAEVEPSQEQNKPDSPPKIPAEENRKVLETEQSSTDLLDKK